MNPIYLKKLTIVDSDNDHPAVPAICIFLYFAANIYDVADKFAYGLENYIDLLGFNVLKNYTGMSGNWKSITKSQLVKDLKHLKNFPKDHIGINIEYDSGEGGEPGEFGFFAEAYKEEDDFPNQASFMRMDFPFNWLEKNGVDKFINFIKQILLVDHVQTAHAGFTFKCTSGSVSDAVIEVNKRLPRFLGFAPCDFDLPQEMLGHTFTAHWLNYIDNELVKSLGGFKKINSFLSDCELYKLEKGLLIQSSKLPPLGDINRNAPDLGWLPKVSRILRPLRLDVEDTCFADADPQFNAVEWMKRLDNLDPRPWDNTNVK